MSPRATADIVVLILVTTGCLFLLIGVIASYALIDEHPNEARDLWVAVINVVTTPVGAVIGYFTRGIVETRRRGDREPPPSVPK